VSARVLEEYILCGGEALVRDAAQFLPGLLQRRLLQVRAQCHDVAGLAP
jgi:hypothetical protein